MGFKGPPQTKTQELGTYYFVVMATTGIVCCRFYEGLRGLGPGALDHRRYENVLGLQDRCFSAGSEIRV